jgi:hypothetical protein
VTDAMVINESSTAAQARRYLLLKGLVKSVKVSYATLSIMKYLICRHTSPVKNTNE